MYIDWLSANNWNLIFRFKKARSILLLAFAFWFMPLIIKAQNLVPNPSFETYTSCPTASGQLTVTIPWYGTNLSSDYFNGCASGYFNVPNSGLGFQNARTGVAFAAQWGVNGPGTNYREYMQVPLTNSLVIGNCYFVRFYVNYPNTGLMYACNNFAAHLSTGSYATNFTGFPATTYSPQIYLVNNPIVKDTLIWSEIGGIYTALGGEKYLTIGNFKNDANTDTLRTNYGSYQGAYYFIDDVSVEQITTPTWQLKDTMILSGDSVLIGPLYSGLTCNWFDMIGTPIGNGAALWVKPTITTSYVMQQTFCNTTFSDTMTVYVSALGINEIENDSFMRIYPNPVSTSLHISILLNRFKNSEVRIMNYLDQAVLKLSFQDEIDVSDLSNGIYILEVKNSQHQVIRKKFIVAK